MDLSGIAALLALAGIPVSMLIVRWQMRAALDQAEMQYRAALETAEANRRSALEAAEVARQSAAEVAREQLELERARWIAELRGAAYRNFHNSVSLYRRSLLADELDTQELQAASREIHDNMHAIRQVGPDEVSVIASRMDRVCYGILMHIRRGMLGASLEERTELWKERVAPLRAELSDAIKQVNSRRANWRHLG